MLFTVGDSLTHWKRAQAAVFITVATIGTLAIVDMFLTIDIGDFVISPPFVGATFGISYLVAPFITKYIKLE